MKEREFGKSYLTPIKSMKYLVKYDIFNCSL